jgi:hypothetical protein
MTEVKTKRMLRIANTDATLSGLLAAKLPLRYLNILCSFFQIWNDPLIHMHNISTICQPGSIPSG